MGYQEDFIAQIAPHVTAWRNYLGFGVASAIIAQACLESAYGRSNKAYNYNNFFGLKYKEGRELQNLILNIIVLIIQIWMPNIMMTGFYTILIMLCLEKMKGGREHHEKAHSYRSCYS